MADDSTSVDVTRAEFDELRERVEQLERYVKEQQEREGRGLS